jgi:Ca-activated chloride channel family protein
MASGLARFAVVLWAVPLAASAGILIPKEPGAIPLSLRRQTVTIEVKDQVARATVEETFENHTDRALEGTYKMPLPEGAATSGFATWVDGQRVESRVQEKEQAKATYERAQNNREQPAMLEQDARYGFTTRVDGIAAHGTKRIEAKYAQILPYDAGLVTMRIPLGVESAQGTETVGQFNLSVIVSDQKKITELTAGNVPAKIERLDPQRMRLTFEAKDVSLPKELLLTYRTESSRLGLSFLTYRPEQDDEGYFLLLASPQEVTESKDIVQKDVIFVFDTSGSMSSSNKIQQAQVALKRCLSSLGGDDRFGIVAFSDSINPYFHSLKQATAENVADAIRFSDKLEASGGTNIHGGLVEALKMEADSKRPRVIVLMTDGEPTFGITNPQQLAKDISDRNVKGARVFTFGVGPTVNKLLLERMAAENRGTVSYIDGGLAIDKVVGDFYASISRPVLSDLGMTFGSVTTKMRYPDVMPDMYKGSQLVVVGRYSGSGQMKSELTGMLNGKKVTFPFKADFPRQSSQDSFVARLWAQRRIDHLMLQNRLNGELQEAKEEIIRLSKVHHIITQYTSMIAVRSTPVVASVTPERVKPGDPWIRVRAPRSATVTVRLPSFAQTLKARWNEREGLFGARFLVPAGTPDGSYPVLIEIDHADGTIARLEHSVAIDTQAPAFAAAARLAKAGSALTLHAQAVLSPGDVAQALLTRSDRGEAMKSLFDIRRVTAHLWDGRDIPLTLTPGGFGFYATAETNTAMAPGSYEVVITAQDFAGNTAMETVAVEVR